MFRSHIKEGELDSIAFFLWVASLRGIHARKRIQQAAKRSRALL